MNINCPHCTAYLTVPEQYSGQLMKCPKCNSNFTVPALPAIDQEPAFAMAQSPPAPAAVPAGPLDPARAGGARVPTRAPRTRLQPHPDPRAEPGPRADAAPDPDADAQGYDARRPAGHVACSCHVPLSRAALEWVAVGSVVLLFIFLFFPWVGVYPGGVPAVTQNAWDAAFGSTGADPDMKDMVTISETDAKSVLEAPSPTLKLAVGEPSKSLLLIFYLLPFFLVTLVVSIAVAMLPFPPPPIASGRQQPPPLEVGHPRRPQRRTPAVPRPPTPAEFRPRDQRQGGGSEQGGCRRPGRVSADAKGKPASFNSIEGKRFEAIQGIYSNWFARTIWLKLALVLHILATLAAATVYWMEKRGASHMKLETGVRW